MVVLSAPLERGGPGLGVKLAAYSTKQIKRDPELISRLAAEIDKADLVLLYRTSDDFWDELEQVVLDTKDRVPVVVVGPEPSFAALSNVNPEITATVYRYILFGGSGNMRNMLAYLLSQLFGSDTAFESPEPLPWQGIYHPAIPGVFSATADFLSAYKEFLSFEPGVFCGPPLLPLELGQQEHGGGRRYYPRLRRPKDRRDTGLLLLVER